MYLLRFTIQLFLTICLWIMPVLLEIGVLVSLGRILNRVVGSEMVPVKLGHKLAFWGFIDPDVPSSIFTHRDLGLLGQI